MENPENKEDKSEPRQTIEFVLVMTGAILFLIASGAAVLFIPWI